MRFYLGTHQPEWVTRTDVPLFLSRRRLATRTKNWKRARGPWALDSGGFSELSMYGEWRTSPAQYVAEVRRWSGMLGPPDWCATQDWMCEPFIIAKTGLSVAEHQRRSVASYVGLMSAAPDVPWVPVLQGWEAADYHRHVGLYQAAGVELARLPTVGVGSVCRRQGTREGAAILEGLAQQLGRRLHGFGFKIQGLRLVGHLLASADSMAWSATARREQRRLPGCTHVGADCRNCLDFALHWRAELLRVLPDGAG